MKIKRTGLGPQC